VSSNLIPFTRACFYRFDPKKLRHTKETPVTAQQEQEDHKKAVETFKQEGKENECIECMLAIAQEQANKEEHKEEKSEPTIEETYEDISPDDHLYALKKIDLKDVNGTMIKFMDLFNNRDIIVLALLRHFGWVFCRQAAAEFAAIYSTLQSKGVGLVAVGSGTSLMAKDFAKQFNFPGELYVDQQRQIYEALDCKRGLKYAVNLKVLKKAKEAMAQGFTQGKTEGDSLQLGGAFVLSKKNGVMFEHLEEFAGDHADLKDLLASIP